MAQKERENFYRILTVIVDHGKESLSAVLENDCANTKLTFEDFINRHQHDIYHLCYNKSPCCKCPTGRFVPANKSRILYPGQLDLLLDTSGSTLNGHNPNTSQTSQHCCRPAKTFLSPLNLDITLLRCLLMNFAINCRTNSILRQDIEDLVKCRNTLYGHAQEARLTDSDYAKYKTNVESIILRIARFSNTENEMQQKLHDAYQRPLDETILMHYHNTLTQQSLHDRDMEEKVDKLQQHLTAQDERLDYRMGRIEGKVSEVDYIKRNIIDDEVPIEIRLMADKKYIPLYLQLLESGSEKKRDIRLVIVGKQGAGKTSLVKRLFGEVEGDITSTNGIDIHRIKCKTKSNSSNWKKIDGHDEEKEPYSRLLKPYEEKLKSKAEDERQTIQVKQCDVTERKQDPDVRDASSEEAAIETNENNTLSTGAYTVLYSRTTDENQTSLSVEQVHKDITMMLNSEVDLKDKEEYATLLLWDFAGDENFYHTHQTFLSPDAIYLVVTNLNEADDKEAQGMFRLWMDSIHCYCIPDGQRFYHEVKPIEDTHDKCSNNCSLNPPVILVGTWKDKLKASTGEETENACRKSLDTYAQGVSDDTCRHIRDDCTYFISNTEDNDNVFKVIREDIIKLAREMKTWNIDYPLKFIQLEMRLREKKKELPIISFHEMKHIADNAPHPLNYEELILFLKFHHELRTLVYFEDISDCIVLDTQWLSDAFKIIVTAEKFQLKVRSLRNKKKWDDLNTKGILHHDVLEDIFKKEQHIITEHKDHILKVMEKFDIIIRPNKSGNITADKKPQYYVPCMIKEKPTFDIYKLMNATEAKCKKSTWLCFKFRFLPPHLMNHLIASLCRQYDIAEVAYCSVHMHNRPIALFKGTAVFELTKTTKLQKLLITTYQNLILVQVLEFGTGVIFKRGSYNHISKYVTGEINKIITERFKMSSVNYEISWECGLSKPEAVTGSFDFSEEEITEYYCQICGTTIKFCGEWSDLPSNSSSYSYGDIESDPESEIPVEHKTVTSTKVLFKGSNCFSTKAFQDLTCASSKAELSKKESNFSKMGLIAVNILADALYDRLKLDGHNVHTRKEYDISKLYAEHRQLNIHRPSNTNNTRRGPWGGSWRDIQNTDTAIGDDIERIRLTRNELNHSPTYELADTRFVELCNIIQDLLERFNQRNKPTVLYTERLEEVLAKTISEEDTKHVRQQLECKINTETEFQIEVLHEIQEPKPKRGKY